MLKKIDHVGLVVADIKESLNKFSILFDSKPQEIKYFEDMKIYSAFIDVADNRFELIEPTAENEGIYQYLQKKGQGLHHVSFQVENLDELMKKYKSKGMKLVIQQNPINREKRIAFVHPKDSYGLLIELLEV